MSILVYKCSGLIPWAEISECKHNHATVGQIIGQIVVPCIRFTRPVGPTIGATIVPCKRTPNCRPDSWPDRSARRLYHVNAILERIIKEQMLDFLYENELISRHQHGFLSMHSTSSQIQEAIPMIGQ